MISDKQIQEAAEKYSDKSMLCSACGEETLWKA